MKATIIKLDKVKTRHIGLIHTEGSLKPQAFMGGKHKARKNLRRNSKSMARQAMREY